MHRVGQQGEPAGDQGDREGSGSREGAQLCSTRRGTLTGPSRRYGPAGSTMMTRPELTHASKPPSRQ